MALKTPSKKKAIPTTLPNVTKASAGKKKVAPPSKTLPKPKSPKLPPTRKVSEPNAEKEKVNQTVQRKARTGEEVTKPDITSECHRQAVGHRPSDNRTKEETPQEQLTLTELQALSFTAKKEKFKELNKDTTVEKFVTILKSEELPKKMVMRLAEAKIRKVVAEQPKNSHYCPYCVSYMPFHTHSWSGYTKCCGCGISTQDFYIKSDNKLFS